MAVQAPADVPSGPETSLHLLQASIRNCTRCESLVSCRSRVVPGDGAAPAAIAFIGIAPGRFGGDRTGIPFSGDRSGELLRRMIKNCRLPAVFITNLVRCNPRDQQGRNRDPTAAEIANCRAHLKAELALAQPGIVVCLGRIAWHELAGPSAPFAPKRGRPILRDGLLLIPMYHPAFVNRGAYPVRSYHRDFRRLARFSRVKSAGPVNWHAVKSPPVRADLRPRVKQCEAPRAGRTGTGT